MRSIILQALSILEHNTSRMLPKKFRIVFFTLLYWLKCSVIPEPPNVWSTLHKQSDPQLLSTPNITDHTW